jgi:SAM-dependent methyltransferase
VRQAHVTVRQKEDVAMTTTIDQSKLDTLLEQMLGDMGAAAAAPLVVLGDRLGLYKTLAANGGMTTQQLADETSTAERYVREWCSAQAGFGYIDYDPQLDTFSMSPEQAAIFADDDSPACMTGGYYGILAIANDEPKIEDAFKTGDGVGWEEHHPCLFCGTEKFFRPGYQTSLVSEWLAALDGVVEKLQQGATVADVGCGHGVSTMVMAKEFPNSQFIGFDFHEPSVDKANELAKAENLPNLRFEVASAKDFQGNDYDLIAFFDCLHDMGDPVGAIAHSRQAIKTGGTLMVVEPFANDELKDNLNPVGRMFYCFSTMVCTPASLSQEVGLGLGAQAGERRLKAVINEGGFSHCHVATSTPFNMILEAKA